MRTEAAPDAAASDELALLRALSEASTDVIYAKDLDGRLRYANPAAVALIGKPLAMILGRTDAELLEDRHAAAEVMANDRRIMTTGVGEELEERVPLPDGTERIWLSQKMPYRDAGGRVRGLLGISRDITERTRAATALRDSEERLRLALEAADLGAWELDLRSDRATRSLRHDQCFGYREPQPVWGLEIALRHVLEEDRPIVLEAHQRAADTGILDHQVRVRWPDGTVHWIHAHGLMHYDQHGRPERISGVVGDVTRARETEAERERLLHDLRAAHAVKDEFMAMLSHELRTPLNVVLGYSRMLRALAGSSDTVRRWSGIIERNAVAQLRLVEDLLDVQRIASGRLAIHRTSFDLAHLLSALVESLQPLAAPKGQRLTATAARTVIEGDRARIQQVVWNLVTNAIKFTPAGGAVTVTLTADETSASITVADTGEGIPPGFLPHLFEPFRQFDMSATRRHGGLGLGLAIAHDIVQAHGGRIAVDSVVGEGSRFTVHLPRHGRGAATA